MTQHFTLSELGWTHFFQQHITLDEWESCLIGRVISLHRSSLDLITPQGEMQLHLSPSLPAITVGDWMLLTAEGRYVRLLDRFSLFSRKAAGSRVALQLIAANIDTLFVVSSMNLDFNLSRIERYLALAHETGVEPVIVLTKADCCDRVDEFIARVRSIDSMITCVAVNSLDRSMVLQLEPWCQTGKTVAFMGSSGVGKSTLINTLTGDTIQSTQTIREDDSKGRHTTTRRSLHRLPNGAWLLDTPGMRELQLVDCEHGLEETFSEVANLARHCRFSDCTHQTEPGCAIQDALKSGDLDERRLRSYLKLMKEQAWNNATLAEKRDRDRAFGKMVRTVIKEKSRR